MMTKRLGRGAGTQVALGRWALGWAQADAGRGWTGGARQEGGRAGCGKRSVGGRGKGSWGARHGRCVRGHARPGLAAGPAGCVLGALSLF